MRQAPSTALEFRLEAGAVARSEPRDAHRLKPELQQMASSRDNRAVWRGQSGGTTCAVVAEQSVDVPPTRSESEIERWPREARGVAVAKLTSSPRGHRSTIAPTRPRRTLERRPAPTSNIACAALTPPHGQYSTQSRPDSAGTVGRASGLGETRLHCALPHAAPGSIIEVRFSFLLNLPTSFEELLRCLPVRFSVAKC